MDANKIKREQRIQQDIIALVDNHEESFDLETLRPKTKRLIHQLCLKVKKLQQKDEAEGFLAASHLSRETLELAIKGSRAGIWDWPNVKQEKVLWDPQCFRLLGYEANEFDPTFAQFQVLLHPAYKQKVMDALDAHFVHKLPYNLSLPMKTKQGQYKWFQITGFAKRDKQQQPTRMVGSIIDIHQQKETEEHEKHYQYLLEESQKIGHIGSWEFNLKTEELKWTTETYKIFERAPSSPIDIETFIQSVYPDDREKVFQAWDEAQLKGVYNTQIRLFVNNQIKWVHSKGRVFYDNDGTPSHIIGFAQDISPYKKTVTQLRQHKEYTKQGADIANIGFWKYSPQEETVEVTAKFKVIYAFTDLPSMPTSQAIIDRVHPADRDYCSNIIQTGLSKGQEWDIEHRLLLPNGKIKWVRGKGKPIVGSNGEEPYIIGSVQDITQEKATALTIKKSKEQYEKLFNLAPDFMFKSRIADYQIVDTNKRAINFYGYSKEELLQMRVHDLQAVGEIKRSTQTKYAHIPIGHVVEVEGRHKRKDGSTFPVSVNYCKIDEQYIVANVRDISLYKLKNKEIQDLKYALDKTAIVAITNKKGEIIAVNDKFCEISKYARHEILGNTHNIINSDYHSRTFWKGLWQTIGSGQTWVGEIRNRAKDGSYYWVHTSIIPFLDDMGKPIQYIAIRTDITQRKKMETDLRKAKKEAEQNAKIKENFLANMSHEIRTPMNGVFGFARLLLQTDINQTQRNYLESIYSSAENLLTVVNDILDISKIESGTYTIKTEDFNLQKVIKDTLSILQLAAKEKGLKLGWTISDDFPPNTILLGDPKRLAQIIINLVGNAIKFTKEGYVDLSVFKKDQKLYVEVTDTGIGIPPNKQATIFDSFTQVENYQTREHDGTGLGLAICKKLVLLMGSDIWLQSTAGEGATFSFYIPLIYSKENISRSSQKQLATQASITPLILLVEDYIMNQKLVVAYLKLFGCDYDLATNGEEALAMHQENTYDLILMDIQMPKMNGISATVEIRKLDKETPIVAMTAHTLPKEKEKCFSIGMNDYLSKPFRKEDLEKIINQYARKGQEESLLLEINAQQLLQEMGGNQALVKEILLLFKEELISFSQELKTAIQQNKAKQVQAIRHKIKPSLQLLQINGLLEVITDIQNIIQTKGTAEHLDRKHQLFESAIPQLLEQIDDLLK